MSDMIERTSFDTPTLPRLSTILGELQRGVWQIPQFQRPSVWDDEQRLDLLDSIVKGLPIGSFLVWRSATHELKTYKAIAGNPVPESPPKLEKRTYLIDGHQRISTLYGALTKPTQPRQGPDAGRWPIYYELGSEERPAFRLPPRGKGKAPSHWLPLDILLDRRELFLFSNALFLAGEDKHADEAERIANVFKDYIIPVVPLVTENLDLVTDAFVRINSKGSDMTEAHMLRALTYLKPKIDTDKGFKRVKDALRPLGFGGIPDQPLVNSLKAILGLDVYRASVTELNERLKTNPDKLAQLKDALVEAVILLRFIGVKGWGALPYAYQLVTLAALAARAPGSLNARRVALRRWFWRTTYAEHYTGQTGGQIRRDIDTLADSDPGDDDLIAYGAEVRGLNSPIRQNTVRMKAHLLFLAKRPNSSEARLRRQEALADSLAGEPGRRALPRLVLGSKPKPGNLLAARKDEVKWLQTLITKGTLTKHDADEHLLPLELVGVKGILDEALVSSRAAQIVKAERAFVGKLGLRESTVVEEEPDAIEDDED